MNYVLFDEAARDLAVSEAYYNDKADDLGKSFLLDFLGTMRYVTSQPLAWPPFLEDTRRCNFSSFPHYVVYKVRDDHVRVLAVGHQRQRPEYWLNRL